MDADGCILSNCGELIPTPTTNPTPKIKAQINIFPNPLGLDVLKIDIQSEVGSFENFTLKIYNFQGKILQQSLIHTGHNQIDFSQQSQGIYLLVIEKNGIIIANEKVVK